MWLPAMVALATPATTSMPSAPNRLMARLRMVTSSATIRKPSVDPPADEPSSSTTGVELHPAWVEPSRLTVEVSDGNAEPGAMVQTPPAWPDSVVGMAKSIASTTVEALASSMAARRVHWAAPWEFVAPVSQTWSPGLLSLPSAVELTTRVSGPTT